MPDPDAALDALERFVATAGPRTAYLARLASTPALLGGVLTFFTRSERLAQTLIARPELLDALGPVAGARPRSAQLLCAALRDFAVPGVDAADRLRLFKQREELEIAWRDLVLDEPPARVAWALGELAEASVRIAWEMAVTEAEAALGAPLIAGQPVPALVVGMGKLGGRELDYGSDLDLVVLYGGRSTSGPDAHVYFDRVVDRLYTTLTAITRTGQVFRVDLRLRQGQGDGPRPLAGDARPVPRRRGRPVGAPGPRARPSDPRRPEAGAPVHGAPAGTRLRSRALRRKSAGRSAACGARMEVELGREGPGRIHLKFGAGGLVDIEFLVQVLQLTHGARHGALRTPSTRLALSRLGALGFLPEATARGLLEAHAFLRRLLRSLRLGQVRPPDCPAGDGARAGAAGAGGGSRQRPGAPRAPPRGGGVRARGVFSGRGGNGAVPRKA